MCAPLVPVPAAFGRRPLVSADIADIANHPDATVSTLVVTWIRYHPSLRAFVLMRKPEEFHVAPFEISKLTYPVPLTEEVAICQKLCPFDFIRILNPCLDAVGVIGKYKN